MKDEEVQIEIPTILYKGQVLNSIHSLDSSTLKADFIPSRDFQEVPRNDPTITNDEFTVFENVVEESYLDASNSSLSECFSLIPSESQEFLTKAKKANYIPLSDRMMKKMF